jgi:hypothetical protein
MTDEEPGKKILKKWKSFCYCSFLKPGWLFGGVCIMSVKYPHENSNCHRRV